MARDPGSVWKPLPEAGAPDGYRKNKFIVHSTGTMASAAANWAYFNRANVVVESTFIVGWGPDDPTLQIMDSTDLADANADANDEGISVEVVGDGIGPYNDWQISELVRLGLWTRREHPLILPQIIPSPAQGSAGFGWHVMFGAPGPWTSVRGKECPGARRIQQLKDTVFPAIFAGRPFTGSGGFMAALTEEQQQKVAFETTQIYNAIFSGGSSLPEGRSLADMIASVPARVWGVSVFRPTPEDPEQKVSALQELADAKSLALAAQGEAAGLRAALDAVAAGRGVDLDAVRAAAKAGAEEALKGGVKVTVDVPGAQPSSGTSA